MKSLRLTQPHVIAMAGVPGAGKTQFATQFAKTFNAPLISMSVIEPHIADEQTANEIAYTWLIETMKTKQTVLFDGQVERRVERMDLVKTAKKHGYKVLFVWAQVDEATARQRSLKTHLTEADFERRNKRFSPLHESEISVVISGKHTYSTQAKTVLRRISEPRAEISAHKTSVAVPRRQAPTANRIHVN